MTYKKPISNTCATQPISFACRLAWGLGCTAALLASFSATGCLGNKSSANGNKTSLWNRLTQPSQALPAPEDVLDPLGARNVNRVVWQDLTPGQLRTTIRSKFTRGQRPEAAKVAFDNAQQLYDQATGLRAANPDDTDASAIYLKAAQQFRVAASLWPDSALEQDALFYEGESYFFCNRYVQANRAFEKLVVAYPGTRYLDVAESRRFAVAQYWLGLARENSEKWVRFPTPHPSRPTWGLAGESRRILNRIRIDDPTGKLADDATMALGNAFFEAKMYQEAAETYEDLRKTYPGTPHLFQAHMLELKARMNSYYGSSYDSEPLQKADALMHQIVRLFPDEAEKQRDYLSREASSIRSMLAEREYSLGSYYERRGENRAAQMMYEQVAQNYQDTELGMQVNERIVALEGKPPVPKQHAQWLVDLMPHTDHGRPLIANRASDSLTR